MKKIVLVLLLMIPFFVNADTKDGKCDQAKYKEYVSLSNNITYDNNYSLSANSFNVTIYNVIDGMEAVYNNKNYKPGKDNTVTIEKIPAGSKVIIQITVGDNCSAVKRILINEPYYNKYYGTQACAGYENILIMCSSRFTSVEVTKEKLEKSIYNYNHNIDQTTTRDKEVVEEETVFSKITSFLTNWGIKIALAIISTIFSISLFTDKYRKVKHGI